MVTHSALRNTQSSLDEIKVLPGGGNKRLVIDGNGEFVDGFVFDVLRPNVTITGMHFREIQLPYLQDDGTTITYRKNIGVRVGRSEHANMNVTGTRIVRNRFTDIEASTPVRITLSGEYVHNNTLVQDNFFQGPKVFRAIQVGNPSITVNWDDYNTNPPTINADTYHEYKYPENTVVRDNVISALNKGGRYSVAIQLYSPTVVENNCVVGPFYNGISAKGSFNNVVGNTIAGTIGDGALYIRDGDSNLYANNVVLDSDSGFTFWSGTYNIMTRNHFERINWTGPNDIPGSAEPNHLGVVFRGGHDGERSYENLLVGETIFDRLSNQPTNFDQSSLRDNENYWLRPKDGLITRNTFKNYNPGLRAAVYGADVGFNPMGVWVDHNGRVNNGIETVAITETDMFSNLLDGIDRAGGNQLTDSPAYQFLNRYWRKRLTELLIRDEENKPKSRWFDNANPTTRFAPERDRIGFDYTKFGASFGIVQPNHAPDECRRP